LGTAPFSSWHTIQIKKMEWTMGFEPMTFCWPNKNPKFFSLISTA